MPSCRHCSQAFEITPDDVEFYEKVSPVFNGKKELIPPPTLCPECRSQRRLSFRNERNLYHRKCDVSGKQIISIYSQDKPQKVYEQQSWWSDVWDPLSFGKEYDASRSFFEQMNTLMSVVPRRSLVYFNNQNSDYTNVCSYNKDCYLLFSSDYCENCFFVSNLQKCDSCVDCSQGSGNQFCYESLNISGCHTCFYCYDSRSCSDCFYCFDCANCKDCAFSTNLRGKQFCLLNQQLSEQEYRQKLAELSRGSFKAHCEAKNNFVSMMHHAIRRFSHNEDAEECTGDYIGHSQFCRHSFNLQDGRDAKYVWDVVSPKDCYDCNEVGFAELCHEVIEIFPEAYNVHWSCFGAHDADLLYCDHCYNSQYLFGCVGMKKATYCILNKQYTKEEYETLVPKIIAKMREDGEWGEFFPLASSPFGYNETVANEYYPLTKEEVLQRGWKWHDEEERKDQYLGPPTLIPDDIRNVPDDITKQILTCEITGKPYKIIPQELKFYREMNIPIPRKCPDQRHKERMALRNPRKLWNRQCAKCQKAIETTYAPERPEIVYCEECYLETVY